MRIADRYGRGNAAGNAVTPVTKPVTPRLTATRIVPPLKAEDVSLGEIVARLDRLELAVAAMTRCLGSTETFPGIRVRRVAMTPAEKQAAYRARKRGNEHG